MSDDESAASSDEGAAPAPAAKPAPKPAAAASKPAAPVKGGIDQASAELLEANRQEFQKMQEEISELKIRNEKRKKEREALEKKLAAEQKEELERKKAADDDKRKKKEEEEASRKAKMSKEIEGFKGQEAPNLLRVISQNMVKRKSRCELDEAKKLHIKAAVKPLEIDGLDAAKLSAKAKEFHDILYKLESDKYDLEMKFKLQQVDLVELSETVRNVNKVGKGGLKRIKDTEEIDIVAAKFTGTPAKVLMFNKWERQKDKRHFGERKNYHSGPRFAPPIPRIAPARTVKWGEDGLPTYVELGAEAAPVSAE